MASSKVSDLTLANYLKIVQKGVVYNNLSEDSSIWDNIGKFNKGPAEGRSLDFVLRSAYGANAVGFMPVSGGDYPSTHQSSLSRGTAQYKDFALTVDVERTLVEKAISDFSRWGEPLAEELRSKGIALSRLLSISCYQDGTGALAEISGAGTVTAGTWTCPLLTTNAAYGGIGFLELGDQLVSYDKDGTISTFPTEGSGTHAYWQVQSKDRANNTVALRSFTSAGVDTVMTASGATAGEILYKRNQTTFPDINSGGVDYNTFSEMWPGLESLSENDGRTVNGISMTGALGGTRRDASANPIDSQNFQEIMSDLMIAVGQGRYKYDKAQMSWEALNSLIESRETDRRFQSVTDEKRGVTGLGYQHGKNSIMFDADEFCRKDRIYLLPSGGDVLQFHGSDFEFVKLNGGQHFFLKTGATAGEHARSVRAYMEGSGVLVSTHSAAIGCIENFTVS